MTSGRVSLQHSRFNTENTSTRKVSKDAKSTNSEKSYKFVNKKSSFDALMNRRNNLKIKKHFGREDFVSRAQIRLNALR
jgi:hypothetical protein